MSPNRPFSNLSPVGAVWRPDRIRRSKAAAGRLEAALRGFERSILALRKAALDHVDSQDPARLTLCVVLDRRAERGRTA